MTLGKTFFRCPMYFKHLAISTVLQNRIIPSISWSLVVGLASLRMNSLSSCQRFSIGLRSGDSARVFHQLMELSFIQSAAYPDVCFGSLSCINLCSSGKTSVMNGTSVPSRMLTNSSFMIPSKMHIPVLPFFDIPAHTCTLVGCLGLKGIYNHVYYWVHKKLFYLPMILCTVLLLSFGVHMLYVRVHVHVPCQVPGFWTRGLSSLSAGKSSMALHLYSALVAPNNVIKRIVKVVSCPSQSLSLVHLANQLTIGAASKGPAQSRPASEDCSQAD